MGLDLLLETTVKRWKAHDNAVEAVLFAQGGRVLFSAGKDQKSKWWDVATGSELPPGVKLDHGALTAALTPDGRSVLTGGWGATQVWDMTGRKQLATLPPPHQVRGLTFVQGGGRLAWAGFGELPGLDEFDADRSQVSPVRRIVAHAGGPVRIAGVAEKRGAVLTISENDPNVRWWDIERLAGFRSFRFRRDSVRGIAASADGETAARSDGDEVVLWDLRTGRRLANYREANTPSFAVLFSPDGKRLVTGWGDGRVRILDGTTLRLIRTLEPLRPTNHAVALSPDGRRVAACTEGVPIRLWEAESGKQLGTIAGSETNWANLAFSPDGAALAQGCGDGVVRVWDVGRRELRAELKGHRGVILSIYFKRVGVAHRRTAGS